MTKTEYGKCVKLMEEAIRKAKQADEEYKEAENYTLLPNYNDIQHEIEQRKADQHYGEATGINQALATLGFKHDRMKELAKLL